MRTLINCSPASMLPQSDAIFCHACTPSELRWLGPRSMLLGESCMITITHTKGHSHSCHAVPTPCNGLTSEKLREEGIFLWMNGSEAILFFGQGVPPPLIHATIGESRAGHAPLMLMRVAACRASALRA